MLSDPLTIGGIRRRGDAAATGGRRKRAYAYEIVVLAPGDEPVMPKEVVR